MPRRSSRKPSRNRKSEQDLPPTPLTEAQARRVVKPRPAVRSVDLEQNIALFVASEQQVMVEQETSATPKSQVVRPGGKRVDRKGGIQIQIRVRGAQLGTHVFPPPVPGKLLKLTAETAEAKALARRGLPDLDGYLPDHLPLNPVPPSLDRSLKVRRYLSELEKPAPAKRNVTRVTTVFPPENRYTFSDTSFPWCTIGRVDTAGGLGSGVLVGPRHILTVSHAIVWNPDNSCGWVRFRPSFFDGSAPFGEAWAIRWYAYRKVTGPTLDTAESREDFAVLVLNTRIGDVCGWMGSRTYSDSWDGTGYWRHIGYPGDLAAGQRPSYQRDISLDGEGSDSDSHKRAWHMGDVWPGQSGGPYFAWWSGESWPRVVAVQSGQQPAINLAAAGSRLVNCIIAARNDFP